MAKKKPAKVTKKAAPKAKAKAKAAPKKKLSAGKKGVKGDGKDGKTPPTLK